MTLSPLKNSLQQTVNWHYYVYSFLAAILAVCIAVQTSVLTLPPALAGGQFYAAVLVVFLTAFLPRIQTQTGPGAEPLISPPPKAVVPNPKV